MNYRDNIATVREFRPIMTTPPRADEHATAPYVAQIQGTHIQREFGNWLESPQGKFEMWCAERARA